VVLTAADEQVRIHVGGIDEVLLGSEGFVDECLLERRRARRLVDRRWRRVDVRQQVGLLVPTGLRDVNHIPRPHATASFAAVARVEIIGRFAAVSCGR
jgi:hypothetical protein